MQYGILIDINKECPMPVDLAYEKINEIMADEKMVSRAPGFYVPLYYGKDFNPITCILLVQKIAHTLPWLKLYSNSIRLIEIKDMIDLKCAI